MSDAEFTPLFAEPQDGESVWNIQLQTKLGEVILPMVRHQIVQEIKDQTEIKASQRKAILRVTQKAIIRAHKLGRTKLSRQDMEQYCWNHFILRVDEAIKNRHAQIREDADVAETIADEGHFTGA